MAEKYVDESKVMQRMSDFTSEPKRVLPPIKGYENQLLVTLEQSVESLHSIVSDVEQMVWTVKQNCENPCDGLTCDESASIMLYTLEWISTESSFYFILNQTLRNQNRTELRPWFAYLRLVMHALAKLPSTSCRTIYRGIQLDMSKEFVKNSTFIWWSFSSCTSTIDVIKSFLGNSGPRTIINIECDTAKDISQHSFYRTENEILLFPARQLKVISSIDVGNQLHITQLKEVQPPFPLISIPEVIPTSSPSKPISQPLNNQKLKDDISKLQDRSTILLRNKNLTDDDIELIVNEGVLKRQCTRLILSGNKGITSIGASIIGKSLDGNSLLTTLELNHTRIGDTGIEYLSKILARNTSALTTLWIMNIEMTDTGVDFLAQMLKTNRILEKILLGKNNITDQGIQLLADVLFRHNRTLKELSFVDSQLLSKKSADIFFSILNQNDTLISLNLTDCHLLQSGKEKLQKFARTKEHFDLIV